MGFGFQPTFGKGKEQHLESVDHSRENDDGKNWFLGFD